MSEEFRVIRVAVVQAEPVFLDLNATTQLTCDLIAEAGSKGADLIAFPETFIPAFPNWYGEHGECRITRDLDKRLFLNSIDLNSEQMAAIAESCKNANVNAVLGINEKVTGTTGTMYNTQVYITRDGVIAGKHQKYVPTTGERFVHAPGKTGMTNTFKTDFGTVSSLICGENSNPLGVYAAATQYPVVHVASWPALFARVVPMRHAMVTSTSSISYAIKCFSLNAVSRISAEYIDAVEVSEERKEALLAEREKCVGAIIIDPLGNIIADGTGNPDSLLIADLDLSSVIIPKMIHDVAGHYNRPELFKSLFE